MTSNSETQAREWLHQHQQWLHEARTHLGARSFWSAFAETPSEKVHGAGSHEAGKRAFTSHLGRAFTLPEFTAQQEVGNEHSPYGLALDIRYPTGAPEELTARAIKGGESLAALSPAARAGVALEILARLWARKFELGYAVMHTTGQGFVMAFQAGVTHALDRALEAIGYAVEEIERTPQNIRWEKPRGKHEPLRIDKQYHAMPRGVGLVVACATFPTWNGYPPIFANLVCGNAVIIKPHPAVILPLAITVEVMRETLADCGLNSDAVMLAADSMETPLAPALAQDPCVKIIDFTGSSTFGNWLEQNAPQARVFTEKSGVNCALVDALSEPTAMARNLALSLSLYSGQMCTSPQNIFIPRAHFAQTADALRTAMDELLGDELRAAEILGTIQSPETIKRVEAAAALPDIIRHATVPAHPSFTEARMRSPLLVRLDSTQTDWHRREHFGPISFLIETSDAAAGLQEMRDCFASCGALTAAIWSDDEDLITRATDLAASAGVNSAVNLQGDTLVNFSAAFSDYHGTGSNAAGNACLIDSAFITPRFYIAQSRRPAP